MKRGNQKNITGSSIRVPAIRLEAISFTNVADVAKSFPRSQKTVLIVNAEIS
jgi:hypothetical protein